MLDAVTFAHALRDMKVERIVVELAKRWPCKEGPNATQKRGRGNFVGQDERASPLPARDPQRPEERYMSVRPLAVSNPNSLNVRQEAFARNIAEGRSQREARNAPDR